MLSFLEDVATGEQKEKGKVKRMTIFTTELKLIIELETIETIYVTSSNAYPAAESLF